MRTHDRRDQKISHSVTHPAVVAGSDVNDIRSASSYLLCKLLCPTSNERTNEYGRNFENWIWLSMESTQCPRCHLPDMPLFFRISTTESLEGSLLDEPS
ncbi:hypothetical protein A0H81_02798 [Grifola frondosa]|uniref:Uncharacterized protein n=1 Tax=Grifola frondosa TaxID=5627 RepID=A0A1C7MNB1_GRIFR|nr:hypothetical protein A0H81_02798 [Grifola frondosa]